MNKKIIIAVAVLIAVLFLSSMAEITSYYNGVVNNKRSEISSLNCEIANQSSQISNLTAQVANLTTANLVTALGVTEVPYNYINNINEAPLPYNHLYITGSVNNTGEGRAYNAGLHVVAYSSTGGLGINMTVPLGYDPYGAFGSDATIDAWLSASPYGGSSLQLVTLYSGENMLINLSIFHEGTVSNWTVTPVWTNSP